MQDSPPAAPVGAERGGGASGVSAWLRCLQQQYSRLDPGHDATRVTAVGPLTRCELEPCIRTVRRNHQRGVIVVTGGCCNPVNKARRGQIPSETRWLELLTVGHFQPPQDPGHDVICVATLEALTTCPVQVVATKGVSLRRVSLCIGNAAMRCI